jgi:hypothetical protein
LKLSTLGVKRDRSGKVIASLARTIQKGRAHHSDASGKGLLPAACRNADILLSPCNGFDQQEEVIPDDFE